MSWVNSVLRQFLTNGPSIYSLFSSKLPGFTTALFQRKPGKVNYARNEKERDNHARRGKRSSKKTWLTVPSFHSL